MSCAINSKNMSHSCTKNRKQSLLALTNCSQHMCSKYIFRGTSENFKQEKASPELLRNILVVVHMSL